MTNSVSVVTTESVPCSLQMAEVGPIRTVNRMPLIRCPHCGEDTFAFAGWAAVDHCANCGRPLGGRPIELGATLKAKRRFSRERQDPPDRAENALDASR